MARKPPQPREQSPQAEGGDVARARAYPKAVDALIAELAALPGIGRRSAERLAFHVLKTPAEEALRLAEAIREVKRSVRHCELCWNLSDGPRCSICDDPRRDKSVVLVVEQPKDLIALEQTGMFSGVYHVLMGRLSPLEGVEPGDLTIPGLIERVEDPEHNGGVKVREVILGLNPTLEGDGTMLYLGDALRARGVGVSRLARGLPSGSQLEYANKAVLADALAGRQKMD